MRSRKSNPFAVSDIIDGISRDRDEQFFAQVAALSCQVSLSSIKKGINNHIINGRKKPKSKYEWNKERVRDFRVAKGELVPATVEQIADDLETYGKASYVLLQTDPVPFVRNYKHEIFHQTLKMLNPLHPHFHSIEKLDLSDQLLGDDRFNVLCEAISKSSIKFINISGNKITSTGIKSFSNILRSLHHIEHLNISRNKITDEGIGYLFSDNTYSSTLKSLNCSYNTLNSTSAYYIGLQFKKNRNTTLNELILGGKVGLKGWGDDFIRVLSYSLIEYNIKQLKRLIISDAGITEDGLNCITMLLLCDHIELIDINISKNGFSTNLSRNNLITALRLNRSLINITINQCGFTEIQVNNIINIINTNNSTSQMHLNLIKYNKNYNEYNKGKYIIPHIEEIALSYCIAYTYNICKHIYHKVKISFLKDNPWRIQKPPFWILPKNKIEYNINLITNINILFHNTQIILPNKIKNSLDNINNYIKYIDLLYEALQICKNLTNNPKLIQLNNKITIDNINYINNMIENIENNIIKYENLLEKYQNKCDIINNIILNEIELYINNCEGILKIAKRRERKNILLIINDICNNRINIDILMFCIEDYNSLIIEHTEILEKYISILNIQKLLYFYLIQENTKLNENNNNKEIMNFDIYVQNTIPYYSKLKSTITFIHYFYLTFSLERNNHKLLENMALQQLEENMQPILTSEHENMPILTSENENLTEKVTIDNKESNEKEGLIDNNNNKDKERRRSSNKRRSNIVMGKKGSIAK